MFAQKLKIAGLTAEQMNIFRASMALSGFSSERDYLLYLLARDLTPVPGAFDYKRGELCAQLQKTPTPDFWKKDND